MTHSCVAHTDINQSGDAGAFLGSEISTSLGPEPPDAVIVFASPKYDYPELLRSIESACRPKILVGCSSAGEFATGTHGEGSASAVAIRSSEMLFAAGMGRGLRADSTAAAKAVVSSFHGPETRDYLYRSALVLTDALAGYTEDLIGQLTLATGGSYQFFGGGAGDDGHFRQTHVFYGREAIPDAVVALEILSNKPLGVGLGHGWQPAGPPLRVTEADGMRLISLNAIPAVELFQEHAEATGQRFNAADPLPFFLHNVLGIDSGMGYKLRVPLAVNPDGSVSCAAEIPIGATVRLMGTTSASASQAASEATQDALRQLKGERPGVALFFDCAATRLRMGKEFGVELSAVQAALGAAGYAGCNTYGQVARAESQFSGFHNCTAVVCVIPE